MFCDRLPCPSPVHTDLSVGCLHFAGGSGSSKDDERIAVRVFSVLALTPGVYVFADSSKKVEIVRTLLSEDPAMLLRETLGISADGSEKMYRDDEVTLFEQRQAERMVWIDRDHRCDLFVLWVLTRGRATDVLSISVCVFRCSG